MTYQITVYEFTDPSFAASEAVVCVARLSELKSVLSLNEINEAFSGYATYWQTPWMTRFVGVWGRKNCQRLRRFIRERGADITVLHERPLRLRLAFFGTKNSRAKIRSLDQLNSTQDER